MVQFIPINLSLLHMSTDCKVLSGSKRYTYLFLPFWHNVRFIFEPGRRSAKTPLTIDFGTWKIQKPADCTFHFYLSSAYLPFTNRYKMPNRNQFLWILYWQHRLCRRIDFETPERSMVTLTPRNSQQSRSFPINTEIMLRLSLYCIACPHRYGHSPCPVTIFSQCCRVIFLLLVSEL